MAHAATQQLAIELDSATIDQLGTLAQTRGRDVAQLLSDAVQQYLVREGRREALLQETIAAWSDTGMGSRKLSPQQADAWLSELEAGTLDAEPIKPD